MRTCRPVFDMFQFYVDVAICSPLESCICIFMYTIQNTMRSILIHMACLCLSQSSYGMDAVDGVCVCQCIDFGCFDFLSSILSVN